MKIIEFFQQEQKTYITLMWDDRTCFPYVIHGIVSKEAAAHDAYIIGKTQPRQPFAGELHADAEDWHPDPKPSSMEADFYRLTAKVYDQYGAIMDVPVDFSIDGQGAVIKDGELVTEEVDAETTFFIVAKCGDLEERQERTLYPRVEPGELPDAEVPVSRSEFDEIKAALDDVSIAMAEMIGG